MRCVERVEAGEKRSEGREHELGVGADEMGVRDKMRNRRSKMRNGRSELRNDYIPERSSTASPSWAIYTGRGGC